MKSRERVKEIMSRLEISIPDPRSELNYSSNFELLTAVMLSAQTTDKRVNEVTAVLFQKANTPLQMMELGEENIFSIIKSIGLARTKSHNLAETARMLHNDFQDEVPHTFEDLIKLPGVGGKTARVVLNVGFGEPVIAVDTHIHRVANRLKLSSSQNPDKISLDLSKVLQGCDLTYAHHYLLLHGRRICRARNPLCTTCTLNDLCTCRDKQKILKQSKKAGSD